MNRWISVAICFVLALLLLAGGWLLPAHLRAVDVGVLKRAGRDTPSLTGRGFDLLNAGQLGPSELICRAAQQEKISGVGQLASVLVAAATRRPQWQAWGAPEARLQAYFGATSAADQGSFTDFIVQEENRLKALEWLGASPQAATRELLASRALTNTVVFAPSQSAAGQAFDTALAIGGLLLEEQKLAPGLSNDLYGAALQANRGGDSRPLEQMLLDFLSLGRRFNWGQLADFAGHTADAQTLHRQADWVRTAPDRVPALFAAVDLTGKPGAVVRYLDRFGQTGLGELSESLRFGAGAADELLRRGQRLYDPHWRQLADEYEPFATIETYGANFDWRTPRFALILKLFLYLAGGFLLASTMHFARPLPSRLERPLQVRGFHVAREFLFALGFLLVVLLLGEPFLAQDSQTAALPFRLRLPTVGGALHAGIAGVKSSFMNQSNLLIMLLFFVLQALLYTACVVKLAEIRRQRVGPRVRLKLLENEEHLFDAGLYLGFLGTIVSFIIYSMFAHHQFSLMVAYSSTSFGILFVSFFKIFHLRPVRRRLLLEAEADSPEPAAPAVAPSLASS